MNKEEFLEKIRELKNEAWDDDLGLWVDFDGVTVDIMESEIDRNEKARQLLLILFEKANSVTAYIGDSLEDVEEEVVLKGS